MQQQQQQYYQQYQHQPQQQQQQPVQVKLFHFMRLPQLQKYVGKLLMPYERNKPNSMKVLESRVNLLENIPEVVSIQLEAENGEDLVNKLSHFLSVTAHPLGKHPQRYYILQNGSVPRELLGPDYSHQQFS